jgi:hypothetical protein
MKHYWVVNKETKAMIASGDDDFKSRCSIGPDQMWLEVPEDLHPANVKVEETPEVPEVLDEEGNITSPAIPSSLSLIEDPLKSSPLWAKLREERNKKLAECDYTVLADADLTTAQKTAWKAYRQSLRDLPEVSQDPDSVVWPTKP